MASAQKTAPYDVLIIGGGPGGYVAAIRAAQLGLRTALVEREHLGGICLNWGCIPTKALLRSAEVLRQAQHSADYGLHLVGTMTPDLAGVVQRSRKISAQLNGGVGFLLKKNKVDVIWGEAVITKPGEVRVGRATRPALQPQHPAPTNVLGEGVYQAQHIVVATGARPRVIPGMEPDGQTIWNCYDALVPKVFPEHLVVMGSGAIGVEFASFYRAMGCAVTMVELLPQIMPAEDAEIATLVRKSMEKQGIVIHTATTMEKVERQKSGGLVCTIKPAQGAAQTLKASHLLSAVGVVGNSENLGLEACGVKLERGCIVTDGLGRTNVPGLYAIGDVAGPPMLAHKAEHEGVICVEAIKGLPVHAMDKGRIPGCTYAHPQVASVGLTEAKALEAGHKVKIGRFPFAGNGKAMALGEPEGLVKTIFDAADGRLLGAHMVGAEVTELIQGFVVAMNMETTEEELMHTVFPHPTLSEMMHESVLDAYGRAIHK
jgi:dihydrolipoamide dehydrogenase